MAKSKSVKNSQTGKKDAPGVKLEMAVAKIQQMMDRNSTVTHNEILEDRLGNRRQYDVVIRGKFGGRPVLGVIECKDHSRRIGPGALDAFAKKTDNLGANLRIMVSKKGFTEQALTVAKHESIGCLSLLPDDPSQVGFSIGAMYYGVIRMWTNMQLRINFSGENPSSLKVSDIDTVKWNGKPVMNWFRRELFTTYREDTEGEHTLKLDFDEEHDIEIEGKEYPVLGIACVATRVVQKKRKWVRMSGEAFFDWHRSVLSIPPKGHVVGSAVETDLRKWPDYDGEIPEIEQNASPGAFSMQVVLHNTQEWDNSKDDEVPDLSSL